MIVPRVRYGAFAFALLLSSIPARAVPPAEVTSLQFCAGSKTCLTWSNLGAPQYRLYRGTQATLPGLTNNSVESCLVRMVSGATSTGPVLLETPLSGDSLWYLVTAKNCEGEGTAGSGSSGPRTVDSSGDCSAATCSDGIQNGSETDIDCGGGGCASCSNGKACCAGASCASGFCQAPGFCSVCTVDSQCLPSQFCSGSVCVPKRASGQPCTLGNQCQSAFCVDSVCCNLSCTGLCKACNITGSLGTCSNIPVGQDPANECAGASTCNGAGGCTP